MRDRNLYRSGLCGLVAVAVAIAGGVVGEFVTGCRLGMRTVSWCVLAFSLLPWWYFSCSAASAAKAMRWYVGIAVGIEAIGSVVPTNGQAGVFVYMAFRAAIQVAFLVMVLVVMLKNAGAVRKAMCFFVVTTVIGLLGHALGAVEIMMIHASPGQMPLGLGLVTSGSIGLVRAILVAGFLYLMYDIGHGREESVPEVRRVALHWRLFFALAPLIVLLPPHFNRESALCLFAPAGLFGLFFGPQSLNGMLPELIVAGSLAYAGLMTAIVCAKKRRTIGILLALFVVFLLMNAGGCARMIAGAG